MSKSSPTGTSDNLGKSQSGPHAGTSKTSDRSDDSQNKTVERRRRNQTLRRKLARKIRARLKEQINTPPRPVDIVQHYERQKALRERVIANAAPLASALIFAFVVLKVLLVSDANVSTALALVKEAGPIQVFAGVLIVGIPLLGTGFVNAAGILARSVELNKYEKRRLWSYYFGGAFVLSFVAPWSTLVLIAAFPLLNWLLWRKDLKKQRRNEPYTWEKLLATTPEDAILRNLLEAARPLQAELDQISSHTDPDVTRQSVLNRELAGIRSAYNDRVDRIRDVGGLRLDALAISLMITTLAPLLQLSLTSTPWLPAEKITLASKEVVTGYVVSTKDDWATILMHKPRLIRNVKSDQIEARETCVTSEDSNSRMTIWKLPSSETPKYSKC